MMHTVAPRDVFADRALAGNPLAIAFDADDLGSPHMRALARAGLDLRGLARHRPAGHRAVLASTPDRDDGDARVRSGGLEL